MTVIAISRQYGAGGKTLGEMVAKKLGYTFVDDEIIKLMAERSVGDVMKKTGQSYYSGSRRIIE